MFLKRYDLWQKFLIGYQTVYLEQTSTLVTILQWTNTTSLILRCGTFSLFFSLVILFSVLPSNFIVSGVKSSRLYPFLILNVNPFSVIYIYIYWWFINIFLYLKAMLLYWFDYIIVYFFSDFLWLIQRINNLSYFIW